MPAAVLGHQLDQHAFAQAAVGDAQPLARPAAADRLEDGAAGQHQVGPLAADAGIGHARVVVHADERLDQIGNDAAGEPGAVDTAAVVARQAEMDAGQRRDRARGAEHVDAAVGHRAVQRLGLGKSGRASPRPRRPCRRTPPRLTWRPPWRSLRSDHADRQRHPGADAVGHAPAAAIAAPAEVDPDEFRRAAADVEEEDAGGVRIDQRGAAGDRQARLGLARDDLEGQAGLGAHALDEFGAVLGRAAGLGGDQPGAADLAVGELGAADARAPRWRAPSPRRRGGRWRRSPRPGGRCAKRRRRRGSRGRAGWRPAGGNCWCRDRARHRAAHRGARAAATAPHRLNGDHRRRLDAIDLEGVRRAVDSRSVDEARLAGIVRQRNTRKNRAAAATPAFPALGFLAARRRADRRWRGRIRPTRHLSRQIHAPDRRARPRSADLRPSTNVLFLQEEAQRLRSARCPRTSSVTLREPVYQAGATHKRWRNARDGRFPKERAGHPARKPIGP